MSAANGKSTSLVSPAKAEDRSLSKAKLERAKLTEKEAQLLERRVRVYQLRVRGYSIKRISTELGISYGTVRNDLNQITNEMAHEFDHFDANEFVSGELQGYSDLIQEGWNQYHESQNVHQAVKALEFIRGVKMDRFNMLKLAGAVKTDPVQVQHNVSVGVVNNWNDELKQAASEAIIQGMLGQKQLAAPIPDNVIDISDGVEDEVDEEDPSTDDETFLQ